MTEHNEEVQKKSNYDWLKFQTSIEHTIANVNNVIKFIVVSSICFSSQKLEEKRYLKGGSKINILNKSQIM